jgi:hypothetical protein
MDISDQDLNNSGLVSRDMSGRSLVWSRTSACLLSLVISWSSCCCVIFGVLFSFMVFSPLGSFGRTIWVYGLPYSIVSGFPFLVFGYLVHHVYHMISYLAPLLEMPTVFFRWREKGKSYVD